jgi:hypothetical protein
MKKILLILISGGVLIADKSSANDEWRYISQSVTTQMSQNGVIDKSRFMIFTFDFSNGKRDKNLPGYCWVKTITINNADCANEEMIGTGKSFWINSEFSSKDLQGDDFICKYSDINDKIGELIIDEPKDYGDKITHKVIFAYKNDVKAFSKGILDYSGSLIKYSTITNKIESANYIPIKKKDSYGWVSQNMGCNKIALPAISKQPK